MRIPTDKIEALCLSIEHWYENWCDPGNAEVYGDYCPCCQYAEMHFSSAAGHPCTKCLIFEHTDAPDCRDTPWRSAERAQAGYAAMRLSCETVREAFEREYAFLVGLLPNPTSE